MSTDEIMMLLKILPRALTDHPEWFSNDKTDDKKIAERFLRELRGVK